MKKNSLGLKGLSNEQLKDIEKMLMHISDLYVRDNDSLFGTAAQMLKTSLCLYTMALDDESMERLLEKATEDFSVYRNIMGGKMDMNTTVH